MVGALVDGAPPFHPSPSGVVMFTLTIVFGLLLAVFSLAIIIGAFRQGAAQGLLCMFVPFYAVYFAFLKWTWDKRAVVGIGYLVCFIAAPVCGFLAVKA